MKLNKAVAETQLFEAKVSKLLLLDIDDTIVEARNIFIYKKVGNKEFKLTPEEFATENVTSDTKYDFREFGDVDIVSNSIKSGKPIIYVLQYMDHMIQKGYKIGILTARGLEPVIRKTLQGWLMYRKGTKLKNIGGKLKEVFAISDEIKKYEGSTTFEKKANVIKMLAQRYNKIIFVDDDRKNITAVEDLNLRGVKAKHITDIVF